MARRAAGRGTWVAVAGTRPNLVKLAPLVAACTARGRRLHWIHTGQHRDPPLSAAMARDLHLPPPDTRLRAPAPGPERIPRLARRLEGRLAALRPTLVVAVGDVDSTLAAAVAAWRGDWPLVHVEAGLRSFEPEMPEERNRVGTDALSDRLYLPEPAAEANCRSEGFTRARIRKPGNVMADALRRAEPEIEARAARLAGGLPAHGYVVATLHRQANVDDPRRLTALAKALVRCAATLPVVFPVHPRTRARLGRTGLVRALLSGGVVLSPPRPYLDFLAVVRGASAVITDSGGLQVEAALLGVPCVTVRRRTEHGLTLTHGGNRLAGTDARRVPGCLRSALDAGPGRGRMPRAWDGHAAERIVADWMRGFERPPRLPWLPDLTGGDWGRLRP